LARAASLTHAPVLLHALLEGFSLLSHPEIRLAEDIESLLVAKVFLSTYAKQFPPSDKGTSTGGFTDRLRKAHWDALDFESFSATNAPLGFGERISTVMRRVQRIGDRIEDLADRNMGTLKIIGDYDPIIKTVIAGMRDIISSLDQELVRRNTELERLTDARDQFRPK
jgi:hypothetical protein